MRVTKLLKRELDLKKVEIRLVVADVLMRISRWANNHAEKMLDAAKFEKKLWED